MREAEKLSRRMTILLRSRGICDIASVEKRIWNRRWIHLNMRQEREKQGVDGLSPASILLCNLRQQTKLGLGF